MAELVNATRYETSTRGLCIHNISGFDDLRVHQEGRLVGWARDLTLCNLVGGGDTLPANSERHVLTMHSAHTNCNPILAGL